MEVPSSYTLEKNYTNPFNPSTTISFTVLNKQEDATAKVYAYIINKGLTPFSSFWTIATASYQLYTFRKLMKELIW